MTTIHNIKDAIAHSATHNEAVRVPVASIDDSFAEIFANCDDYEHSETNDGEDVFGECTDGEFRLLLVVAE